MHPLSQATTASRPTCGRSCVPSSSFTFLVPFLADLLHAVLSFSSPSLPPSSSSPLAGHPPRAPPHRLAPVRALPLLIHLRPRHRRIRSSRRPRHVGRARARRQSGRQGRREGGREGPGRAPRGALGQRGWSRCVALSLSLSSSPYFSLLHVPTLSSLSSLCAQYAPSSRPSSRTTRTSARPPLRPSRARGSRAAAPSSTSSGGGSCSLCVGWSEREGRAGQRRRCRERSRPGMGETDGRASWSRAGSTTGNEGGRRD